MKSYEQWLEHLFSLNRASDLKSDLSGPLKLAEALGNPQNDFPSIHVGGTNGKGSVATKLAECLHLAGYRVGLFTSPHLFTYRERIQINGEMISEEEVVQGLEKLFQLSESPKFFEITTLLAFDYFAKEEVDVAVIEVGLGGRLDATNIIRPLLSIITSIDYDHQSILGETLEEIAREKAGIIKKGVPVVVGKKAALKPILEKGEKVYLAGESNISIAREALKHIPFDSDEAGLRKSPPCRYERRGDILFDVAHNPAGFTYLFEKIKRDFPGKKIHVLLGMSKDKQVEKSAEIIRSYADRIVLIQAEHPRLIPTEDLLERIPDAHILNFKEAYAEARAQKALTVVTGSFYIMSTIQPLRTSPSLQ
ncbi:MAG: folylpolyglutamate synthase/dihydrofolate synthase family protein [Simkaniaceae bacterium]